MSTIRKVSYGEQCPSCKASNYYEGDVSDYDGLRCWKCKQEFLFSFSTPDYVIDDPNYLQGKSWMAVH